MINLEQIMLQNSNGIDIKSQLVKTYIEAYLQNQTTVGIVSSQSNGTVLAPMTVITSPVVRRNLSSCVPTVGGGGSNITAGLQQCQKVRFNMYKMLFYVHFIYLAVVD